MRQLITSVKELSLKAKQSTCHRSFLDGTLTDPACQALATRMQTIKPEQLGIENMAECPYHF